MANSTSTSGNSPFDSYQTSLTTRYCSPAMSQLFSQRSRHSTWRKLWLGLAECERELGIDTITDEALEQMKANLVISDQGFEVARVEEKSRRHVWARAYKSMSSSSLTSYIGRHGCKMPCILYNAP